MKEKDLKTYIFNPGERIDIGTVDSLKSDLEKVIREKSIDELIIDMKFVQVCDMYGISFLSEASTLIKKAGLICSITEPLPLIKELLKKSGFERLSAKMSEE